MLLAGWAPVRIQPETGLAAGLAGHPGRRAMICCGASSAT
jgi:hypothetical protein